MEVDIERWLSLTVLRPSPSVLLDMRRDDVVWILNCASINNWQVPIFLHWQFLCITINFFLKEKLISRIRSDHFKLTIIDLKSLTIEGWSDIIGTSFCEVEGVEVVLVVDNGSGNEMSISVKSLIVPVIKLDSFGAVKSSTKVEF